MANDVDCCHRSNDLARSGPVPVGRDRLGRKTASESDGFFRTRREMYPGNDVTVCV